PPTRRSGHPSTPYDYTGRASPTRPPSTRSRTASINNTDLSKSPLPYAEANTQGPIPNPLNGGRTIDTALFGEASVDLNHVPGTQFTQDTCEAFGSVLVKTRSSGSGGTAELNDFILPSPLHVSNRGSITIHKGVPATA